MLLNVCLTVRQSEANSHQKKGWEEFTDAVVKELAKKSGLVYMLWGNPAQLK
jgi:uracil-DNA glycosylase